MEICDVPPVCWVWPAILSPDSGPLNQLEASGQRSLDLDQGGENKALGAGTMGSSVTQDLLSGEAMFPNLGGAGQDYY